MKRLILISLFLIMAISAVSASEDNITLESNMLDESNYSPLEEVQHVQNNSDCQSGVISSSPNTPFKNQTENSVSSSSGDVQKSKVQFSSKNIKSTYGKKVTFSVKVLKDNLPQNKKLVVFNIAGKTYNVYSDSKGIASVSFKLNAGQYQITFSCDNSSSKNTVTIKNAYSIKVYKWKSGANIKKNKKIKANIPNSNLVKKIVKAAKKGTPMIKFKGGNGKKVFITAGVHGNELSSQIAAMKLIEYLEDHPIKGTVYIMPFINPKGTAKNVRDYAGVHLNQKANVKGTISYKTVKLIKKFKCDAYGDFHCTKPGGKPGKNVAMGTYKPTYQSSKMAKYISKKSGVDCIIYKKAGSEYPGALEDVVSLNHIPAVTCEVITPHGKIAKGSVDKSFSMMNSLLQFNELL